MIIHTSVDTKAGEYYDALRRKVYTTPKSYLDLISLYSNLLEVKRDENQVNKNRLAKGLKTLSVTNTAIAELKDELEVMQPKL
jgi:dynein heavy chain, axonemal